MNPKELIKCINASCKKSISPAFNLSQCNNNHNFIHYVIDGNSYAVNKQELVKVLKWFDDFWLFIEIKFSLPGKKDVRKKDMQINISVSVFHGEDSDNKKYQLFRAEWDDYDNLDEEHAQPHWHIISIQKNENIFEKYSDDKVEEYDFSRTEKKNKRMFDISKIHFAMNGNWQNDGTYIHRMKSEQQIVNWLQGMLSHLWSELESL